MRAFPSRNLLGTPRSGVSLKPLGEIRRAPTPVPAPAPMPAPLSAISYLYLILDVASMATMAADAQSAALMLTLTGGGAATDDGAAVSSLALTLAGAATATTDGMASSAGATLILTGAAASMAGDAAQSAGLLALAGLAAATAGEQAASSAALTLTGSGTAVVPVVTGSFSTYFGENQSPAQAVSGLPAIRRAEFMARMAGTVTSYGFEERSNGDVGPFNFTFGAPSGTFPCTITAPGTGSVVSSATSGRFNTTSGGTNYWRANETAAAGAILTLTFSTPIAAFGFYGTDVGDFGGALTIKIRNSSTSATTALVVGNTINSASGSLLFYGFVDTTGTTYNQIVFTSNGVTADFFGFDDLVAALPAQVT